MLIWNVEESRKVVRQYSPGVQSVHSVAFTRPNWSLNVPLGHLVPIVLPVGQYLPAGHTFPVIPSFGVELLAPDMQ